MTKNVFFGWLEMTNRNKDEDYHNAYENFENYENFLNSTFGDEPGREGVRLIISGGNYEKKTREF